MWVRYRYWVLQELCYVGLRLKKQDYMVPHMVWELGWDISCNVSWRRIWTVFIRMTWNTCLTLLRDHMRDETNNYIQHHFASLLLRPRSHVSGYFWKRRLFSIRFPKIPLKVENTVQNTVENFRRVFSLDPTDCPWVSEDAKIHVHTYESVKQ